MVNSEQKINICNQNTCNPYLCASVPCSNLIIPQGQMVVPDKIQAAPNAMPVTQMQSSQSVTYNQICPYINTNSKIFKPYIQTRTGENVYTVNEVSSPYNYKDAQLVYEGPIKSINPQITPTEMLDNKINKEIEQYYKDKVKYNKELKEALDKMSHTNGKGSSFKSVLKFLGTTALIAVAITYRKKIPGLRRFFK